MGDQGAAAAGPVDSEPVVEALKSSGELERLRQQTIDRLEHDVELRNLVEDRVRHSSAFRDFQPGRHRRKDLQDDLNADLAPELSQEAVRVLWRVLSEGPEAGGLSQQIDDAVRAALCRQHESKLRQQQQQGQHQQGQGQQQQHGQERQRRGSHGGGT